MISSVSVDIWKLSLADLADRAPALRWCLSDSENERAERFVFERDRTRFIACRAILRGIIAQNLNIGPADVVFAYGEKGKPFLEDHSLFFNLSHSHNEACIALSASATLGIDVEHIRPPTRNRWIDLAQRFFSVAEIQALSDLPERLQSKAFFACWARKEAYLKLHGLGLSLPLDQFSVNVDPDAPAKLCSTEWRPEDIGQSVLYDLPTSPGYRSAIAVAATGSVTINDTVISGIESFPFFEKV